MVGKVKGGGQAHVLTVSSGIITNTGTPTLLGGWLAPASSSSKSVSSTNLRLRPSWCRPMCCPRPCKACAWSATLSRVPANDSTAIWLPLSDAVAVALVVVEAALEDSCCRWAEAYERNLLNTYQHVRESAARRDFICRGGFSVRQRAFKLIVSSWCLIDDSFDAANPHGKKATERLQHIL